jgi:hypothetical protein
MTEKPDFPPSSFLERPGNCYFCRHSPVFAGWKDNQLCEFCVNLVQRKHPQAVFTPIKAQTWYQAQARERFIRVMRRRRCEETFPESRYK